MSIESVKVCTKCKTSKALVEFCVDRQKRDGLSSSCRQCQSALKKSNSHKVAEKVAARGRKWYLENKERALERARAYALKNKEQRDANAAAWYRKNAERLSEIRRLRYKLNPDSAKAYTAKRRAIMRAAGGMFFQSDVKDLFVKQKMRCAVCHESIKAGYHIDHIKPLCLGGDNSRQNIQLLCRSCNLRKAGKDPITFMQQNGRLL